MKITEHFRIATNLQKSGRAIEAKLQYYEILKLDPLNEEALNILAIIEFNLKNYKLALDFIDRGILINQNNANAYNNRGLILIKLNRLNEAIVSIEKSILINPNFYEAHCNLANLLNEFNRFDEAIISYERAIGINKHYAKAYYNLGLTYKRIGQFNKAIDNFNHAIKINKNYFTAIFHKSSIELLKGNFKKGLELYEQRVNLKNSILLNRKFKSPKWTGKESLKNKRILLISEQGLGDTIQFSRYIKLLKKLGAIVLLELPKKLIALFSRVDGIDGLIVRESLIPEYDFYSPLLSLPLAFKTNLETIPSDLPYLSVDQNLIFKWKNYIGNTGFKIGICWQGNKSSEADKGRSFSFNLFENLSKIKEVRLISLQKGDGEEQLITNSNEIKIEKLPETFDEDDNAFLDSAAIMQSLDLVITSDTALTHLAGALGVKTWLVLQYVPDWRWLLDRNDSPWYKNHKIFRQKKIGDWFGVFKEIEDELKRSIKSEKLKY